MGPQTARDGKLCQIAFRQKGLEDNKIPSPNSNSLIKIEIIIKLTKKSNRQKPRPPEIDNPKIVDYKRPGRSDNKYEKN